MFAFVEGYSMKKTGILMPVSALPSKTGVGDMGESAYQWIEILKKNGIKIWQILPLNPLGYGNSPYQPYSSYAGDELYISLELLYKEGLLEEIVPPYREKMTKIEYDLVRNFKEPYLKNAYNIFRNKGMHKDEKYREFVTQPWVQKYGVFRALKSTNGEKCWNEWKQNEKDWTEIRSQLPITVEEEAKYQEFLQYLFFTQWIKLKTKANESGIQIMGDLPFYVGVDSADVWSGKKNFLLDNEGRPTFIAGVPPDYFSETGQRWGNPIYNWEYIEKTNYQFWIDRIGYCNQLFDIIRIDHFRAFDTYWKIPASCPTAIEGEWVEAPGYEVIAALKNKIPGLNLVAEDLGDLRPEVLELKNYYHLKGMKILVFSIETKGKYARDISKETENVILYTGTHDNDTLMEWYGNLTTAAKRKVRRFLKRKGLGKGSVKDRFILYTLKSKAEYVILPAQDILGLGKEGHMNTPGTVGTPNWEWRMPEFGNMEKELLKYRRDIISRK